MATESQVFIPAPQKFSLQYSPFLNYLQPQTYSHHLNSLPPNQLSYIVPAHTSLINSPLKTLSVFPNLYRDSRALCSLCRYISLTNVNDNKFISAAPLIMAVLTTAISARLSATLVIVLRHWVVGTTVINARSEGENKNRINLRLHHSILGKGWRRHTRN